MNMNSLRSKRYRLWRNRALWTVAALSALTAGGSSPGAEPIFRREVIDNHVAIGYGVAVGEVDGDGAPDILLADKTEIVWYKNPGSRDGEWKRYVMARNLTPRDNVCLAARDLNGDGRVEVAVGANWNPGETDDPSTSGALFYLKRPPVATEAWTPLTVSPHDPTVHRMHWVKRSDGQFRLVVLPLHGRGNRQGSGKPVRIQAYAIDADSGEVNVATIDESMHMTHNFDVISTGENPADRLLVAGKEGLKWIGESESRLFAPQPLSRGAGEVRRLSLVQGRREAVAIEPMHGTEVVMYQSRDDGSIRRVLIDSGLNEGHALAAGDFLAMGHDQVVAGWRRPNEDNRVGIRLYVPDESGDHWEAFTIDDNKMACEDIRAADIDRDGQLDIIAAGRATNNLVIYWNDSVR